MAWVAWVVWVVWVAAGAEDRRCSTTTMTTILDLSPGQVVCREVCQAADQVPDDIRHEHPPSLHNKAKSRNPSRFRSKIYTTA